MRTRNHLSGTATSSRPFRGFSGIAGVCACLMAFAFPAAAQWYIDSSTAASHLGGPSTLGPYSTRAEAEAVLKASPNYGLKIVEGGHDVGPGQGSAAPVAKGHEMDDVINQAISAGMQRKITPGQAAGVVGFSVLGQGAINAMNGLADAVAAQQQQQELQRAQQELIRQQELERQRLENERILNERFDRLKGALKFDTFDGDGGALMFKGVDVGANGGGLPLKFDDSTLAGGLALKLGDDDAQQAAPAPQNGTPIAMNADAVPVGSGDGLRQMQAANAAYRRARSDEPVIHHVEMPPLPEQPKSLLDDAQEQVRKKIYGTAKEQAKRQAVAWLRSNMPGYSYFEETYDDLKKPYDEFKEMRHRYDELNATYKGITSGAINLFQDQASAAVAELGSPYSRGDLADSFQQQFEQTGQQTKDRALKATEKKINSDLEGKNKQDSDQVVEGRNPANVVPLNVTQKELGYSPWALQQQGQTKK